MAELGDSGNRILGGLFALVPFFVGYKALEMAWLGFHADPMVALFVGGIGTGIVATGVASLLYGLGYSPPSSGEKAVSVRVRAALRLGEFGRGLVFFVFGFFLVRPGVLGLIEGGLSEGPIVLTVFGAPFFLFGAYTLVASIAGNLRPERAEDRRLNVRIPGAERILDPALVLGISLAFVAVFWAFARAFTPEGATVLIAGISLRAVIDVVAGLVAIVVTVFVIRHRDDVESAEGNDVTFRELW